MLRTFKFAILLAFMFSSTFLKAEGIELLFKSEKPHQVTILESGLAAFQKRLDLIEQAQSSIDLEYFIYNDDRAGKILSQALARAAKRGVKVRLILDNFMVARTISAFLAQEFVDLGMDVRFYNTSPLIILWKSQYRNHRKTFLVDRKKIILGGRNIGDEYFDLSHEYNFVDRDMLVEGEIVKDIANTFDMIWDSPLSENLRRPKRPEWSDLKYKRASRTQRQKLWNQFQDDRKRWDADLEKAKKFMQTDEKIQDDTLQIETIARAHLSEQVSETCPSVTFATDHPWVAPLRHDETRFLKHEIFRRVERVDRELEIDSPYFILSEETTPLLNHLLEDKKAEVKLLTNGLYSTDAIYVASVFNARIPKWIEKGLKAYVYSGDVQKDYPVIENEISESRWGTHSKTFVFDQKDFFIGSYNIDPRSSIYSLEMGLFCDGNPELAGQVSGLLQKRRDNSIYLKTVEDVSKYEFSRISWAKRLGYYLTAVPASLFDYLL